MPFNLYLSLLISEILSALPFFGVRLFLFFSPSEQGVGKQWQHELEVYYEC